MMPGFQVCGPNEALIVSGNHLNLSNLSINSYFFFHFKGCCHSRPYMVPGGSVFVWPGIQMVQR